MHYRRWSVIVAVVLSSLLAAGVTSAQEAGERAGPTIIYFVRHGEVDPTPPNFPLSEAGRRRAEVFAQTVRGVRFTHVFSSHTTRARQMVEPAAGARQFAVLQLPAPGTIIDGAAVTDRTTSRVAIAPLVAALRTLPPGSSALVGVNSDNIYAILNGLGVPVATEGAPCTLGRTCVPCLTNACFPGGEDQLWMLIIERGDAAPTLVEFRYGVKGR